MNTTKPIRDKKTLNRFENYYQNEDTYNLRNYCLIKVGLNTALRISDILKLKYDDVFDGNNVRRHITVRETKTGKTNQIFINSELKKALLLYRKELVKTQMYKDKNTYLFPSPKKKNAHLSRFQAYRIIRLAAVSVGESDHVSCHSLRKTFGYHAWKSGKDPMIIMHIFNHSSLNITKRYLCIEQEDKDAVYEAILL
jgi:integrase